MGIISRIRRVTTGKLEMFLARAEDPEVVFPQLIREMEDEVRAATEAEAQTMAAVKSAERALALTQERLEKMAAGAEAALGKGDEALAREALETQLRLENELKQRQDSVRMAQDSLELAHATRQETQRQLQEIRGKKDELLTRAQVARSQEKIQRTVSGPVASAGSILDAVASMESKIEEKEASLALRRELAGTVAPDAAGGSLERKIEKLNHEAEVERRLAALRQKLAIN